MDDLIKVMKEAEIEFPRLLKAGEVRKLLQQLGVRLGGFVNFSVMDKKYYWAGPQSGADAALTGERVEIMGSVVRGSPSGASAFECLYNDKNPTLVRGLQFSMIPGYSLGEYPSGTVELWRDVREGIEELLPS